MAKKSRSHRAHKPQTRSTRAVQRPAAPAPAPAPREERPRPAVVAPRPVQRPTARREAEPMAAPVDFAREYRYVVADLKRLGILALAMFVILIVLNFAL